MQRIVSASRRTDVPAFFGRWFMKRVEEGFAGWENPFNGRKHFVSLKRDDVLSFYFCSKNYRPFLPALKTLKSLEYPVLFNYTITGLPREFERQVPETSDAVDSLKDLSSLFSPDHVSWRYDPILISDITPHKYHQEAFTSLCRRLKGHVRRCYISFVSRYNKVERNLPFFESEQKIKIFDPSEAERISLANRLAEIAASHGIEMFTCCGDYLANNRIRKAHCVDGELISRLYYGGTWRGPIKPTREECGCTESVDIGRYDTCPNGCIYCYANMNKQKAAQAFSRHDPDSAYLGYTKAESEHFIAALNPAPARGAPEPQMSLDLF